MKTKEKPNISVKPVAWIMASDTPIKYQARATLAGVSILADPQPTPDKAVEKLFQTAVAYVKLCGALAKISTDDKSISKLLRQCDELHPSK